MKGKEIKCNERERQKGKKDLYCKLSIYVTKKRQEK